jgi:hypothetical protein
MKERSAVRSTRGAARVSQATSAKTPLIPRARSPPLYLTAAPSVETLDSIDHDSELQSECDSPVVISSPGYKSLPTLFETSTQSLYDVEWKRFACLGDSSGNQV